MKPNASLVGWKGDTTCAYFPNGIDSAPPGFQPRPQRIADMDYEDGNKYYYKPTTIHPALTWSGVVTTVMDIQYANTNGELISSSLDYGTKSFNITLGIPPAPTSSPSSIPIVIPSGKVAFETIHSSYISKSNLPNGDVIQASTKVRNQNFFILSATDDSGAPCYKLKFRRTNTYIKAETGGAVVESARNEDNDLVKFKIESALTGDGKIVIESLSGTYLRATAPTISGDLGIIEQTTDFNDPSIRFTIVEV